MRICTGSCKPRRIGLVRKSAVTMPLFPVALVELIWRMKKPQKKIERKEKLFPAHRALRPAQDADGSGPDKLLDAVLAQERLHGIDLLGVANDLQDN